MGLDLSTVVHTLKGWAAVTGLVTNDNYTDTPYTTALHCKV